MNPGRRLDFSDVILYGVTPNIKDAGVLLAKVEQALAGGTDAIQLRNRELSDRDFVALAKKIKAKCSEAGALFIIDNRADIALAVDADGVHVGHTDLPIQTVRDLIGHRKIVGASAHSLPQALEAQRSGADYISCGPIWATPTKPEYPAVGLGLIGLYHAAVRVPFVAIGGIDETNLESVAQAGASCVAVVRSLFDSSDPKKTAEKFREKILKNKKVEVPS